MIRRYATQSTAAIRWERLLRSLFPGRDSFRDASVNVPAQQLEGFLAGLVGDFRDLGQERQRLPLSARDKLKLRLQTALHVLGRPRSHATPQSRPGPSSGAPLPD